MNPPKFQNSRMGSTFKSNKHAYIPPGALARGRGTSLKGLASVRVRVEQRTPIGQSKNFNPSTSYQNDTAQNNIPTPPGLDPTEDDVPLSPEVEVMEHFSSFVRHLGILVRDRNMCPLRVHSWTDIEQDKLDHMWDAVTDKFVSEDMNDHNEHDLQHIRRLWNNWRGSFHKNMKSKPFHDALKNVPKGVDTSDWEWLVKEHFLSAKFKETSTRNTINRSKLSMPHRRGSKPIRAIFYELGGKDGKPPNMDTIFFETRKKDNKLFEPETNAKYVEIKKLVQSDLSLTNIEVVEKCFGPQCKSHIAGFDGGITAKELKGEKSSKVVLLDKLKASEIENESLKSCMNELENKGERMDKLEGKYERLASAVFGQTSSPPSSHDE
ncbi:hypothetical protein HAX54_041246 [Datura stramonium]|uniref:Uncharacterized protein n=1 Tax=Datura stramonium TaxID=4076 RepID=A0ABS8SLB0_DATST|nr:hypothetical protein [Datura stramonium]